MEFTPQRLETQAEQGQPGDAWPHGVAKYEPTPERLDDLPDPVFNLEQMSAEQVADLLAGCAKALWLLTPKAKKYEYEEDYDQGDAHEGRDTISRIDVLLQRDIKCLAGRNLEKAEDIVFSLAGQSDNYARATSPDLLRSLYRFEQGDPQGQQRILEKLVQLKQDEDDVVSDLARDEIMDILWSKEVDKATARRLDEVADYPGDRPTWYWDE